MRHLKNIARKQIFGRICVSKNRKQAEKLTRHNRTSGYRMDVKIAWNQGNGSDEKAVLQNVELRDTRQMGIIFHMAYIQPIDIEGHASSCCGSFGVSEPRLVSMVVAESSLKDTHTCC